MTSHDLLFVLIFLVSFFGTHFAYRDGFDLVSSWLIGNFFGAVVFLTLVGFGCMTF